MGLGTPELFRDDSRGARYSCRPRARPAFITPRRVPPALETRSRCLLVAQPVAERASSPGKSNHMTTVFTTSPLQPTRSVDGEDGEPAVQPYVSFRGSSCPTESNDHKQIESIYYLYIIYEVTNAQGMPFPHCRWQNTAGVSIIDVKRLFSKEE